MLPRAASRGIAVVADGRPRLRRQSLSADRCRRRSSVAADAPRLPSSQILLAPSGRSALRGHHRDIRQRQHPGPCRCLRRRFCRFPRSQCHLRQGAHSAPHSADFAPPPPFCRFLSRGPSPFSPRTLSMIPRRFSAPCLLPLPNLRFFRLRSDLPAPMPTPPL